MTLVSRLVLVTGVLIVLPTGCRREVSPQAFTEAISQASALTLYEGLPHQFFEPVTLKKELDAKPTLEAGGFPFYQEPLVLTEADARRLSGVLGDPSTYQPFAGEKKCGGFHPDYAVEWQVGSHRYQALLCLGCGEVKLLSRGSESRYDLSVSGSDTLSEVLSVYRKNRPVGKLGDGWRTRLRPTSGE